MSCGTHPSADYVVTDYPYCADPTGVNDSTAAINQAISDAQAAIAWPSGFSSIPPGTVGGSVYIPSGVYRIDTTLAINLAFGHFGVDLRGAGIGATVLVANSTNHPCILVNSTWLDSTCSIRDLTITRAPNTATSGGDGIKFTGVTGNALLENIVSEGHYFGFNLTSTSSSYAINCAAADCMSHGFNLVNDPSSDALQWGIVNASSQSNKGCGYYVATQGSFSIGVALTGWVDSYSFNNTLGGFSLNGSATAPLSNFTATGCIATGDLDTGFYFNTYGPYNRLMSSVVDTVGFGNSNKGYGIFLANNVNFQILDCDVIYNSYSGIASATTGNVDTIAYNGVSYFIEYQIDGCRIVANNQVNASTYNGVAIANGTCLIAGCRIGGDHTVASTNTQQYGVYAADGSKVVISGCDLTGNKVGPVSVAANPTQLTASSNRGYVTRASGVSNSVYSGAGPYFITVPHGLPGTPDSVEVTPDNAIGTSNNYYVTFDATNIYIFVLVKVTNLHFYWTAALLGNG